MTDAAKSGGSNAYWVSKAAVERLYRGLASELAPDGIAVNCLAPSGVVLTEGWEFASAGAKIPAEYVEAPEVMGRLPSYLAAQDASGITGEVLYSQDLLAEARPRRWRALRSRSARFVGARVQHALPAAGAADAGCSATGRRGERTSSPGTALAVHAPRTRRRSHPAGRRRRP